MANFTRQAFTRYWLPVIVWLGVIFFESISPFAASDETTRIILPVLHWLMPRLDATQLMEVHHVIRKIGHFVGYGLLSYFFFRAWRATNHVLRGTENLLTRNHQRSAPALAFSDYWRVSWVILALLSTITVAMLDELHQMTLKNRTGTWWDVLLDSIGGLVFQFLVLAAISIRTRGRKTLSVRVEA